MSRHPCDAVSLMFPILIRVRVSAKLSQALDIFWTEKIGCTVPTLLKHFSFQSLSHYILYYLLQNANHQSFNIHHLISNQSYSLKEFPEIVKTPVTVASVFASTETFASTQLSTFVAMMAFVPIQFSENQ